ncbi:MAG: hypothetical protein AAGF20_07130 [Pseudomonadota bacterium]
MADTDEPKKTNGPSHNAYTVSQGKDGKGYFHKVGAAFEHKDKQGFDVQMHSTPVNGRLTLRSLKAELAAKDKNPEQERER